MELAGTYGLRDEKLDFHGTLRLTAKLSQATTGFRSFLLKPFGPFFRKNGATVPPIGLPERVSSLRLAWSIQERKS